MACVQTGGIDIYALMSVVCGDIFFHYCQAPEGSRGSCIDLVYKFGACVQTGGIEI